MLLLIELHHVIKTQRNSAIRLLQQMEAGVTLYLLKFIVTRIVGIYVVMMLSNFVTILSIAIAACTVQMAVVTYLSTDRKE